MTAAISPEQRHKRSRPCRVCGGGDDDRRGQDKRCHGFVSDDGEWEHCSRSEHAGALDQTNGNTYAHRLHGPCRCGKTHGEELAGAKRRADNIEAAYPYRDERGLELFEVVRLIPKDFRQRRRDGSGWKWSTAGVRRVLYRLPELLAADTSKTVFIVEGEKDADTLVRRGHVATTNPGGAGKWHFVSDEARRVLRGRQIIVIADADAPGREHARAVRAALADVTESIRIIEPPPPHKDVSDLIAAGGSVHELVAMSDATTPETSTSDEAPDPSVPPVLRDVPALAKVAITGAERIREIAQRPVTYLWQDIAITGIIVLLAGGPGEGKTTLLFLILAARLHAGAATTLLGRRIEPAPLGKYVVIIEGEHAEGSASRKLVKSFSILGLEDDGLDRAILVARKAVRLGSPEWLDIVKLVTTGCVSDIAIDTVARVAPADADNEREQVAIFDSVAQAIESGPGDDKPVVWAVAHTRKNAQTGDLADVSGSAQRTGQADTVLMVKGERLDGRTVASKVTFAKLREEPDDYPVPITFSISNGQVLTSEHRDDDDRPLEVRITEQLHLGPKTKNALARTLNRSDSDVDAALSNLFAVKSITTTTQTVRGRPFKAFKLRTDGAFDAADAAARNTRLSPDSTGYE